MANTPEVFSDIPYVSSSTMEKQTLDIYTPQEDSADPYPVLIFVHGGAWHLGDKNIVTPEIAKSYTDQGIIVVSLNYRLSPRYKHPSHIKDVAAATKWIIDNIEEYGGNSKRMVLTGHSSGAHLIALLATNPLYLSTHNVPATIFNAVIPVDTASFDLTQQQGQMMQRYRDRAFGTDKNPLIDASPTLQVKKGKDYPPFFLYITAKRPYAVKETKLLAAALKESGNFARNIVIDKNLTHRDMRKAIFDPKAEIYKGIMSIFGNTL
jgi:acetyl esterase/lipase